MTASVPGGGGGVTLTRDEAAMATEVRYPPGTVWPLVAEAYAEIGIPVDHVDPNTRVATASNLRVRRIMGKSVGTYFTCAGPFGNTANRDDVFVTLRTQVVPLRGTETLVRIWANAVARASTAANTITDCASTLELEKLIAAKIIERAGG